jgi:hypothetical protein
MAARANGRALSPTSSPDAEVDRVVGDLVALDFYALEVAQALQRRLERLLELLAGQLLGGRARSGPDHAELAVAGLLILDLHVELEPSGLVAGRAQPGRAWVALERLGHLGVGRRAQEGAHAEGRFGHERWKRYQLGQAP